MVVATCLGKAVRMGTDVLASTSVPIVAIADFSWVAFSAGAASVDDGNLPEQALNIKSHGKNILMIFVQKYFIIYQYLRQNRLK